jgi:hypothetical protein
MTTGKMELEAGRQPPPGTGMALLIGLITVLFLGFAPASGMAMKSLAEWHDQGIFLRAATQTIEQGLPDAETRMLVGPAYVGLTLGLTAIPGVDAAQALILLSKLTFVVCAALLAGVALQFRLKAPVGFQVALAAVAVLSLWTSVWFRVTDLPWTHFVAAALLGGMLVTSLSRLPVAVKAGLIGALAITLMQTRLFEAMVAGIAAVVILPVAVARYWPALRARPLGVLVRMGLPAVVGAVAAFAAIGGLSHNWALYQQYGDQQGMVLAPQLAAGKAVQLFWDTCFETLCQFAEAGPVSPLADSLDSWRQPLILQLPGLVAAGAGLLVLLVARPGRILQLPLGVLFAIVSAGGIVLAYLCGAPSGSSHLKYGFFRDFVSPLMLLAGAFIATAAWRRAEDGAAGRGLVVALVVFFAVVVGLTGLRAVGLPTVGGQIARIDIASTCDAGECGFALTAIGGNGEAVPYSDLGYVTCNGQPLAKPVQRVGELRVAAKDCASVAIVPLASGVFMTPEADNFTRDPLDLTVAADKVSVP